MKGKRLSWSFPVSGRARTWIQRPCHTSIAGAMPPPLFSAHQTRTQKYLIFSLWTNMPLNSVSPSWLVLHCYWPKQKPCAHWRCSWPSQQSPRQKPEEELLRRETATEGTPRSRPRAAAPGPQHRFEATSWTFPRPQLLLWLKGDCFKGSTYKGFEYKSECIEHFLALESCDSGTYLYKCTASFPTRG